MPAKQKVRAEVEMLLPAVALDAWWVCYTEASPQFIIFVPRFYFLNGETRHRKVERRRQVCPKSIAVEVGSIENVPGSIDRLALSVLRGMDPFFDNGPVQFLDGDLVRKHLSSELGFSREHRDLNIHRIGYVASEITKNGGIAICAPIAPYDATRKHVRRMIEPYGGFVLVHVATSVEVCEQRDRKGLYAKARAGILKEFTGVSDPYEVPPDAEVVINTGELSPEEAAQEIILYLEREGFIGVNGQPA